MIDNDPLTHQDLILAVLMHAGALTHAAAVWFVDRTNILE